MSIRRFTDNEIRKLNKESSYICESGTNHDVCRPQPSANSDETCKLQCKDEYNAEKYFFDSRGTKMCYCGKAKADCKQYSHLDKVKDKCKDNSKKSCVLNEQTVVNGFDSGNIKSKEQCNEKCQKILRADGLYCEQGKCVCINPSVTPVDQNEFRKVQAMLTSSSSPPPQKIQCIDDNQLYCKDGSPIVSKDSNPDTKKFRDDYFDNKMNLTLDLQKNVFCGCDKDIIDKYYHTFVVCKQPKDLEGGLDWPPTLGNIWKRAAIIGNKGWYGSNFYETFRNLLMSCIPQREDISQNEAIQTLIAYEMCRVTNGKYDRKKTPAKEPPFTPPWLQYNLSEKSENGKRFKGWTKAMVMLMLTHILFRTIVPSGKGFDSSLIYAMFMPQKFMRGVEKKNAFIWQTIVLMTIVMYVIFAFGTKGIISIVSVALFNVLIYFVAKHTIQYTLKMLDVLILFLICLSITISGLEAKNNNSVSIWVASGLFGTLFLISGIVFLKLPNNFKPNIVRLSAIIFSMVVLLTAFIIKEESGEHNLFYDYLFSWQDNSIPIPYAFWFPIILMVVGFIGGMIIDNFLPNKIPKGLFQFLFSTAFGILPIAIFICILNFAIAYYSPGFELFLLGFYRFIGVLASFSPKGPIPTFMTYFIKKPSDKWVMPFLPSVAILIKLFYIATGEPLPDYFTDTGLITGTKNTEMWFS